jgi:hypothetical protein
MLAVGRNSCTTERKILNAWLNVSPEKLEQLYSPLVVKEMA